MGRSSLEIPSPRYGDTFLDVLQQGHICDPENRLRLSVRAPRGRGSDIKDIIYINMRSQFQFGDDGPITSGCVWREGHRFSFRQRIQRRCGDSRF